LPVYSSQSDEKAAATATTTAAAVLKNSKLMETSVREYFFVRSKNGLAAIDIDILSSWY
jgi:hypothetical protein